MKKNWNCRPMKIGLKKIIQIMKLTNLLFLVTAFSAFGNSTYSQIAKLNLNLKDAAIRDVLTEIEDQSQFFFLYSSKMVDVDRKVDIQATNMNLRDILDRLFEGSNVRYALKDNQILLVNDESGLSSLVPQNQITGKVTDVNGNPLAGVSIVVKGTVIGTLSDTNGSFTLTNVPQGGTLVFSFIGMKTMEIPVGNRGSIDVVLEQETYMIDEVVAVGYATQRKMNLTGSVVKVDETELARQSVTSAAQAIQGRVSGVEVVRNNGAPGAAATIRVRGLGTFGNSSPLVLIDGIEGDISLINPLDIESVNVLKDASACAIYGTRAANGVIIVTTKAGKSGTSRIQYNMSTGWSNAMRIPGYLNAKEFVLMQNESRLNANLSSFYTDEQLAGFGEGTDWVDAVLQTGFRQNHNVQFSGGTEKLRYSLLGDYLDETGVVINSWYKRYNVRLNLDTDVTKWLTIGLNAFASHSKQHETPYQGYENPLVVFALQYTPTIAPKVGGMEGTGGPTHGISANTAEWWDMDPVTYSNFYSKNRNYFPKYYLTSSFFAKLKLLEGLNFRTTWGINKYFANNKVFYPSFEYYDSVGKEGGGTIVSYRLPNNRQLNETSYDDYNYTVTNLLTYSKTLNDVHNIDVLLGHNDEYYKNSYFSATAYNFPSNEIQILSLGTERQSVSENVTDWALRSYFGRLNYNYRGKYLAEFSVRRDASSKFAAKYRWGTFPSGSVGWRISDESFMDRFTWINDMKLRASYGILGGQDIGSISWNSSEMVRTDYDINRQLTAGSGIYESYATMNLGSAYDFNSTYVTGAAVTKYANPDIKWEVAYITNLGVDMALFNTSLIINAEYFNKKTTDLILPVNLPATTGIINGGLQGTSFQNVGEMRNTGFEYTVQYLKRTGDFTFDIRYTGSHLKNEILKLQPGIKQYFLDANYGHTHTIGEPYAAIAGYNIIGIYQTQAELDERLETITERGAVKPGDYIYDDTNGDKIISPKDVIIQGSPLPSYIFGLTANAAYKGFDFNIHVQGDLGKSAVTSVRGRFEFSYYMYLNNFDNVLERWHGPGTSSTVARVFSGDANNRSTINTHFIQKTDYAKIRHVELGYTIPNAITRKIGIQRLRVFGNVANLACFTNYIGFEVERTGSYQRTDVTPQSRTVSFGANVQF